MPALALERPWGNESATTNDVALARRAAELRDGIAQHKKAIRIHREQMSAKAAELEQLEAFCAARGHKLTTSKPKGEAVTHGQPDPAGRPPE